jgi:hypothetical protein
MLSEFDILNDVSRAGANKNAGASEAEGVKITCQ